MTISSTEWVTEIHLKNAESEQYIVQIEAQITFKAKTGQSVELQPGQNAAGSADMTESVAEGATSMTAYESGSLGIQFTNKASMSILPSEDFEAWNLTGPDRLKIVSLPGGGLGKWGIEDA